MSVQGQDMAAQKDTPSISMIEGQLKPNRVSDAGVIAAMRDTPREHFVPKALRGVAYMDEDLEVAEGRYLLEPITFARLLEAAEIASDDLILDIGCATGYSSAVLAQLGEAVVAVEEDKDLAKTATERLSGLGIDNVAVVESPLVDGAPRQGPFDVIFLNGGAEVLSAALDDQLNEGGRLVCVRAQDGISRGHVRLKRRGIVGGRDLFDAYVPLLPGFERKPEFEF